MVGEKISELEAKKAGMDAAEFEKQMSALQEELVQADKMRDEILKKQEGRLDVVRRDEHHVPVPVKNPESEAFLKWHADNSQSMNAGEEWRQKYQQPRHCFHHA